MDSFWTDSDGSAGDGNGVEPSSIFNMASAYRTTSLQNLLITLACSGLSDMSINERIYPSIGADLGVGATFSVERKEAKGRKLVAVKHIRKDSRLNAKDNYYSYGAFTRNRLDAVLLEVRVLLHLRTLGHPNIVELLAFGWDEGALPYLVLEYADLGSFDAFLRGQHIPSGQKIQSMVGIAAALELLHACDVIHGDIKLENILVFSDQLERGGSGWTVKLADFGFSCAESLDQRIFRGTQTLNAPEIRDQTLGSAAQANVHTTSVDYRLSDVYSFGIAVWEILNDGARFYTVPQIGVTRGNGEVERALAFLQSCDVSGEEISPLACTFLATLNLSASKEDRLARLFEMSLCREAAERHTIRDVRLVLDVTDRSEPVIAIPLRTPRYSIFDITTASIAWDARAEVVQNFETGCNDVKNEYRGQDAFNLAALYALGYGTHLDEKKALEYLNVSSKYGHLPAMVHTTIYSMNGLLIQEQSSPGNVSQMQLLNELKKDVRSIDPSLRFWYALRSFYRRTNALLASESIVIWHGGWTTIHTNQALQDFLSSVEASDLHKIQVQISSASKQSVLLPLLHYLIITHEELAETALCRGADTSFSTSDRTSLLHVACSCGSKRLVHTLLRLCPDLAVQCSTTGISPLHWLFMFDDSDVPDITKLLVDHGASLERVGVLFLAEFNLVLSGPPLHWAIMTRSICVVRALIHCGINLNDETPMPESCFQYSGFALDIAVCLLLHEIADLLICNGADIKQRPEGSGNTALHVIGDTTDQFRLWLYHGALVKKAAEETVRILFKHGASIDDISDDGLTTLQWTLSRTTCLTTVLEAVLGFNPSCKSDVLFLAAAGLQHDHVNSHKMGLVLEYCLRKLSKEEFFVECNAALRRCTNDGTRGAAANILSYLPSELAKEVIYEEELIHLAAAYDHVEMIDLLLSHGVDINFDSTGTAAATAALFAKRKALRFLLSHGASVISCPDTDSSTTLLHEIATSTASRSESERTLEMVCEDEFRDLFRPVVNNYDDRGLTALHEAIIWASEKNVARLLIDLHANPVPTRDTNISPTSLASLILEHPPWLILHQGDHQIQLHKQRVTSILRYLTSTAKLPPPEPVMNHEQLSKYWTRPSKSEWRPEDGIWDWYTTPHYQDTRTKGSATEGGDMETDEDSETS